MLPYVMKKRCGKVVPKYAPSTPEEEKPARNKFIAERISVRVGVRVKARVSGQDLVRVRV